MISNEITMKNICRILLSIIILSLICSCKTGMGGDLQIQESTEHFEFYGSHELNEDIVDLKTELENTYSSFTDKMKEQSKRKIKIRIYPSLNDFRNAFTSAEKIDIDELPDYVAAAGTGGEIYMISPKNGEYTRSQENISAQAKIELVIILMRNMNKNVPEYLLASIPKIETGFYYGIGERVVSEMNSGSFPSLERVEKATEDSPSSSAYFTLGEYIAETYGYDKVKELIKGKDLSKVLEKSRTDIDSEWLSFVKKTYLAEGYENTLETEHFKIAYNEADTNVASVVSKAVEDSFARVTKTFGVTRNDKSKIIIYSSQGDFKAALLHNGANQISNLVGGFYNDKIDKIGILSPNDVDSWAHMDDIPSLVVHEFTHEIIMGINPKLPSYLNEGTAYYMAGIMDEPAFKITALPKIKNGTFPSMEEIKTMENKGYSKNEFPFAAVIVSYVADKYGNEKLTELIKTADIQQTFKMTEQEFWNDMMKYLKEKYDS